MSRVELPDNALAEPLGPGATGSFLRASPSIASGEVASFDAPVLVATVPVAVLEPPDPHATASSAQEPRRTATAESRRKL